MHRQIAGALTGRVTKWIVLVAVLLLTGIMATFSAKLTSVQNNEASSWLPESAESTKVLEELSETVDPNDILVEFCTTTRAFTADDHREAAELLFANRVDLKPGIEPEFFKATTKVG